MKTLVFLFMILLALVKSISAAPSTITYQGRLYKAGVGAAGDKEFVFTLISSSGTRTSLGSQVVTVPVTGEFSVILNPPAGYDWVNASPSLEVSVDGEVLSPNEVFSATPYSLVTKRVDVNGVDTASIQNSAVTDVKIAGLSAGKVTLPGGSPITTWQFGSEGKVDATKVALPGSSATVASWQLASTGLIDAAKISGSLPVTPEPHAVSHGNLGTDRLTELSPTQIAGTGLVLRSTYSQVIQPKAGDEPESVVMVIKPKNTVAAGGVNVLEIHTNLSTTAFTVRGDGLMTFRGSIDARQRTTFNAPVEISSDLTVSTIVTGGILKVVGRIMDATGALNPVGAVIAYAGEVPPSGWLFCDGSVRNRVDYPELFSVLGSRFGGDGVNTFALPDFRGRSPIGAGQGDGLSDRVSGQRIGSEAHVLTIPELPAHQHSATGRYGSHEAAGPGNKFHFDAAYMSGFQSSGSYYDRGAATFISGPTGSGVAHNNMQPSLAIRFIIKY